VARRHQPVAIGALSPAQRFHAGHRRRRFQQDPRAAAGGRTTVPLRQQIAVHGERTNLSRVAERRRL